MHLISWKTFFLNKLFFFLATTSRICIAPYIPMNKNVKNITEKYFFRKPLDIFIVTTANVSFQKKKLGGKIRTLLPLKKRHLISTINFYNAYSIIIHCKLLWRFGKSAGHLSLPKINIQYMIKNTVVLVILEMGLIALLNHFLNWIKRIKSTSLNIRVTTLRLSHLTVKRILVSDLTDLGANQGHNVV